MSVRETTCLKCGVPLLSGALEGFCRRCLAGAAFAEEDSVGAVISGSTNSHRLGRYELLEEIGHGGMGIVYRARQPGLEREVAIKVMREGPFAGPKERARFRREAAAAARLRHPNIVTVFEEGEADGHAFFSMEFVRGQTLAQLTQDGPLEPSRAARYALAIAQAVHSAHAADILHRDLKPANVIVDAADQPRITDFGLAKRLDLVDATVTQGIIGSPGYMPPEQVEPERGPVSAVSDVYSLGALLYQLLTGRPPFAGASIASTLAQVLHNDPVPPRQLNPSVPLDLETICLKCLEKNPEERYDSARSMEEDLQRFLAHQPIHARPVGRGERLWRWCRRQPLLAALSGGMFLLLLVLAIGSSIAAVRISKARLAESDERERAVAAGRLVQESNLRLTESVRLLELQRAEDLLTANNSATALAQLADIGRRDPSNHIAASRLVSALIHRNNAILAVPPLRHGGPLAEIEIKRDTISLLTAADGVAQRWYIPSGGEVGPPMKHAAPITAARWSSEGNLIATGLKDGSVHLWNGDTSISLPSRMEHQAAVTDLNFDASGSLLVSCSDDGTARVWRVPEGDLIQELKSDGSPLTTAGFAPDGTTNVVTGSVNGGVILWHGTTGEAIRRMEGHTGYITSARFNRDGSRLLTASRDGTVFLWDTASGVPVFGPLRCNTWVLSAEFSPDESLIVAGGQDGAVRLWTAKDGLPWGASLKHDGAVRSAVFDSRNSRIATASLDVTARIWDGLTGEPQIQPLWHGEMVAHVAFAWGGTRLITGSADNLARIWSVEPRQYRPIVVSHAGDVYTTDISPDGKMLSTGSTDQTARLWDITSGRPIGEPFRHGTQVTAVSFSPDGKFLATGGLHDAQVWNVNTGQSAFGIRPRHQAFIRWVRFNQDGDRLLTVSADGTARVWDARSGQPVTPPLVHEKDVWYGEFSPDGRFVATASLDETARVWDARTGQPVSEPLRHRDNVDYVTFSPDSTRILTASGDNLARVWDYRTSQIVLPALTHTRSVLRARYDESGRRIATASIDRTARIWDAHTGRALTPPMLHKDFVNDVQFSPDGQRLLTSCSDRTIRLWDAATGRPLTERLTWGLSGFSMLPRFTPDGRRILASSITEGVSIWEFPPVPVPVPAWFASFAEDIAGLRIGAQGNAELAPRNPLSEFRDLPDLIPDGGYYSDVARWLIEDIKDRSASPFSGSLVASDHPGAVEAGRTEPSARSPIPLARSFHSAVWTGSEMIIWGGFSGRRISDGWCYSPASNLWSRASEPSSSFLPRLAHTAVWTGHEMIIWGGVGAGGRHFNDGARYSPTSNLWTMMLPRDLPNTPSVRSWHAAVWTGREMIVWGGEGTNGRRLNDGACYDPVANTWRPIPGDLPGTPSGRNHFTAVWTGSEMMVWGGSGTAGALLNDGARYDPASNRWTPIPDNLPNTPVPRQLHTAVWTGREMIIWGGSNNGMVIDGGRYDVAKNVWIPVTATGAPSARTHHRAIWTGTEMVVWGGLNGSRTLSDGGRYNPESDQWSSLGDGPLAARTAHTAVWTGSEMIVWGGDSGGGRQVGNGARYNPTADRWDEIVPGVGER